MVFIKVQGIIDETVLSSFVVEATLAILFVFLEAKPLLDLETKLKFLIIASPVVVRHVYGLIDSFKDLIVHFLNVFELLIQAYL